MLAPVAVGNDVIPPVSPFYSSHKLQEAIIVYMMGVKSRKTARQSGDGNILPKSSFSKHVRNIILSLIEDGIFDEGTTIAHVRD